MSPTLQTLLPVGAGIAVVVIGILVFRVHAFFALLLAAATTAALTPREALNRADLAHAAPFADLVRLDQPTTDYFLQYPENVPSRDWLVVDPATFSETGQYEALLRVYRIEAESGAVVPPGRRIGRARLESVIRGNGPVGSRFEAIFSRPGADRVVVNADALAKIRREPPPSVPSRIASAFGDTVASIGLLIAFAAVIGMGLLDSGAADRIVRSALKLVGERGAPAAFMGSGFLLGVPVFFDTVFLLLIPLGKALRLRTGRNYLLYVLTIFCGATMAHSLVPPTPGPLLVAERLGVNIGTMIVVGSIVGLIVATYGIAHAWVANRLLDVPLRDTPEMPLADLERLAARPDHELPPLWASLLPIALPLLLIAQQATLETVLAEPPAVLTDFAAAIPPWFVATTDALGDKTVAVGVGVVAALILLARQTRQTLGQLQGRVGAALASGGSIILITAAGGAFGKMIEQTGVASLLKDLPDLGPAGLLAVAFLVTAAIRTAQGSATVAMITAVGIFGGVEPPFHPVWLALAIGCGSKPLSWMTDSGFWVICKMSGMTEAETLKTLTPMTGMLGLVGLATVIAGATLFPMS